MADIAFVRRNLKGMAVSGLWNYYNFKNPLKRILFYIYGKIVYIYFFIFNTTEFMQMYKVRGDFMLLMQNAGVTLLYGLVVLKASVLMFQKSKIEYLLAQIRHEENRTFKRTDEEIKIYNEAMDHSWFVTRMFWFTCSSTVAMFYLARPAEYYVMGPQEIFKNRVPLIFSSWFPFDPYEAGYHELAFVVHFFGGLIGGYYVAVADTFIVGCMIFGAGQFRIIQCAIRNLDKVENPHEEIDSYFEVIDIVKHHCRITTFLADLDRTINPIIFLMFFICSLLICSVGLEGIMIGLTPRLAQSIYYLVALLIQLYIFYWHANEVTLEGFNIANAVTESNWYKLSHRVKHGLIMIMTRSGKPVELFIGGFYPMSLKTFLMILKASYSYLALFRQMYLRDQAAHK